ncbi:HNH endonuclease [Burkholderia ambifaria]|uniref:HNH endonuclease n=1 Tax=Burkholderia ambifaria TaxID=152480 RepID=UPI001C933CD2|nr:HNH endonuclease [Burkholderia ambifaria]
MTGLAVPELLRVSHIKRWANSEGEERLNPANALLLAPHLDAAFDRGLASFDDSGNRLFSPILNCEHQQCLGLLPGRLTKPPCAEQRAFLAWHRAEVFRRRENSCYLAEAALHP